MKILLSARGLAGLAWLSTFGLLWLGLMGGVPAGTTPGIWMGAFSFSAVVAIGASALASNKGRKDEVKIEGAKIDLVTLKKLDPPKWTDRQQVT